MKSKQRITPKAERERPKPAPPSELITSMAPNRMAPSDPGPRGPRTAWPPNSGSITVSASPTKGRLARVAKQAVNSVPQKPVRGPSKNMAQLHVQRLSPDIVQDSGDRGAVVPSLSTEALKRYVPAPANDYKLPVQSSIALHAQTTGTSILSDTELKEAAPLKMGSGVTGGTAVGQKGLPIIPAYVKLTETVAFNVGVYITTAHTGGGKTGTILALIDQFNRTTQTSAQYIPLDEPRMAPFWRKFWAPAAMVSAGTKGVASDFVSTLKNALAKVAKDDADTVRVLAIDSVVLRMKMFGQGEKQATFEKGYQVSDREFFNALSNIAYDYNLVIFATMNTEGITYVPQLRQGVEGLVTILSVGRFTMQDRGSSATALLAREDSKPITLDRVSVAAALKALKFGN